MENDENLSFDFHFVFLLHIYFVVIVDLVLTSYIVTKLLSMTHALCDK
jgi:hypothetical protein